MSQTTLQLLHERNEREDAPREIHFTAYGTPAPKGSTKAFYRPGMRFPVVTEDNKRTRPWAAIIKDAAIQAVGGPGTTITFQKGAPVVLWVKFYMPRPASLPRRVQHHTKKPDVDKMTRCVLDSLTEILWVDDSQVVRVIAEKVYAANGEMPRAEFTVETVFT